MAIMRLWRSDRGGGCDMEVNATRQQGKKDRTRQESVSGAPAKLRLSEDVRQCLGFDTSIKLHFSNIWNDYTHLRC